MALVFHLEGVTPRDNIIEMRRTLGTVKRDLGVKIDGGVEMPVLPLFQGLSAHTIRVVHVHKLVLVGLTLETLVVVSVRGVS